MAHGQFSKPLFRLAGPSPDLRHFKQQYDIAVEVQALFGEVSAKRSPGNNEAVRAIKANMATWGVEVSSPSWFVDFLKRAS